MISRSLSLFNHEQRKQAFTLVEILAVIAVVSILATILVSGVSRAIQSANAAESRSNLRQIGALAQLYAMQNEQKMPHGKWNFNREHLWLNALYPMAYDKPFPGFVPSDTGANLKDTIFYSPAVDPAEEGMPIRSYGWNIFVYDTEAPPGADADQRMRINQIRDPARHALAGDTLNSTAFSPGNIHFRNLNRANVLFIDGHVEALSPEEVPSTGDGNSYNLFWHFNLDG
mgnify:CR=1 FL=1